MRRRIIQLAIWTIIICLLTLLPRNCFPQVRNFWDWLQWDKLVHLLMFGVFSILFLKILTPHSASLLQHGCAFITGWAFGGLIELLQFYVIRGRSGNLFDFYADGLGCLLFLVLYAICTRRKRAANKIENRAANTKTL